jgi:hypothetical protein
VWKRRADGWRITATPRTAWGVELGHYLHGVFPAYMRPDEIAAGVELLESRYEPRSLRYLAGGLLCVGRNWDTRAYPSRWGDVAGLQMFLTELVADCASRRHAIARLRGAQAGFLLHGLLLMLPEDLPIADGPGLTSVPVTPEIAARIRAGVANPIHAAALAAALFTGLDPTGLTHTQISALSGDAAALSLFEPARPRQADADAPYVFFVPEPARPLLRAARTFLQLRGADPDKRLLTAGIGANAQYLAASTGQLPAGAAGQHQRGARLLAHAGAVLVGRPRPAPAGKDATVTTLITRAALNYAVIRARVADLGLLDAKATELLGVRLVDLEEDLDQRTVSLTLLVRIARALDLTLDELVIVDDQTPPRPDAGRAGDDAVVLALVASYNGLHVGRVLNHLGWSHDRLDAAIASLADQLAPTPLRLAVTDHMLMLTLRPGALPALTRERFDRDHALRRPLDPKTAVHVLKLVHDKILEPFPSADDEDDDVVQRKPDTHLDTAWLIDASLAIPAAQPTASPGPAEVEIHPDVMFALRLTDAPAVATAPDQSV